MTVYFSNLRRLMLDRYTGFYVASNLPLESIEGLYIYEQPTPSNLWSLKHNFSNPNYILAIYKLNSDGTYNKAYPKIIQSDDTTINLDFNGISEAGYVCVLFAENDVVIPTPTPTQTITPTITPTPTPAIRTIYVHPSRASNSSPFNLTSDSALTSDIQATTASVTRVIAYSIINTVGSCPTSANCEFLDWIDGRDDTGNCGIDFQIPWGSNPIRDSRIIPFNLGSPIVDSSSSFSFDPSSNIIPVFSIPELIYDSVHNTINGVAGEWWIMTYITTDVGDCIFISANTGSCV